MFNKNSTKHQLTNYFKYYESTKIKFILIIITIVGFFFFTFRLKETQIFSSDFARDTLRSLDIYQNKEITFIGAPVSFGQFTNREAFFTSASIYIGVLGLALTKLNVLGPVLPNTVLYTISIPLFYVLTREITKNERFQLFALFIYALSPLTVNHSRFFWTPNLIIPISVVYWLLTLKAMYKNGKHKSIFILLAGLLAGFMFNIHYLAVIAFVLTLTYLLANKKWNLGELHLLGFTGGILPFFLFEVRNQFYLTKTFFMHLMSGGARTGVVEEPNLILRIPLIFSAISGFRSGELRYDTLFDSTWFLILSSLLLIYLFTKTIKNNFQTHDKKLIAWVSVGAITWSLLTQTAIHTRYLFSVYPVLVVVLAQMVLSIRSKVLTSVFVVAILSTSWLRITWTQQLTNLAIPINVLEEASSFIVGDNPSGRYNITENMTGDAQATPLRFFVQRDAVTKPQGKQDYEHLSTLYVLSPDEQTIYNAKRWEYTATHNLSLTNTWDIGEIYLYKFQQVNK